MYHAYDLDVLEKITQGEMKKYNMKRESDSICTVSEINLGHSRLSTLLDQTFGSYKELIEPFKYV